VFASTPVGASARGSDAGTPPDGASDDGASGSAARRADFCNELAGELSRANCVDEALALSAEGDALAALAGAGHAWRQQCA
jgi:hypothetical protein